MKEGRVGLSLFLFLFLSFSLSFSLLLFVLLSFWLLFRSFIAMMGEKEGDRTSLKSKAGGKTEQ